METTHRLWLEVLVCCIQLNSYIYGCVAALNINNNDFLLFLALKRHNRREITLVAILNFTHLR